MENNSSIHHRKFIRLKGFDYSQTEAYFITTNVQDPNHLLCTITNDLIELTDIGTVVNDEWSGLPDHYPQVEIDEFVIMPDHFQGIIILHESQKPYSVSEVVRNFKTYSAKKINSLKGRTGLRFWQRNYYEHVVRDDMDLNRICQYIQENPLKWQDGLGDISPSGYFK
jgi:REP element-mobilizing transposase RayT